MAEVQKASHKGTPAWKCVLWPLLVALAIAAAAALLADVRSEWFRSMALPDFAPPDEALLIAIAAVFACDAGLSVWLALHARRIGRRDDGTMLCMAAVGLVHLLWALVFFTLHGVGAAVFVLLIALLATLAMGRRVWRLVRWPALLLLPDALLCAGMLVLNYAVAMIN